MKATQRRPKVQLVVQVGTYTYLYFEFQSIKIPSDVGSGTVIFRNCSKNYVKKFSNGKSVKSFYRSLSQIVYKGS